MLLRSRYRRFQLHPERLCERVDIFYDLAGFITAERFHTVTLHTELKGCWSCTLKEPFERCEVALEVFETHLTDLHDLSKEVSEGQFGEREYLGPRRDIPPKPTHYEQLITIAETVGILADLAPTITWQDPNSRLAAMLSSIGLDGS